MNVSPVSRSQDLRVSIVEDRSDSKGGFASGVGRRLKGKMLEVWWETHLKGSYSLKESAPVTLAFMNQVRMLWWINGLAGMFMRYHKIQFRVMRTGQIPQR